MALAYPAALAVLAAFASLGAAAGHGDGYSTQSCQAFPGEGVQQVLLLTVNRQFVDFFKNFMHFAAPSMPNDMKVVVWPQDDAVTPKLEQYERTADKKFVIAQAHPSPPSPASATTNATAALAARGRSGTAASFLRLSRDDARPRRFARAAAAAELARQGVDAGMYYVYGSKGYKQLVSRRPGQIKHFLDQGCSVLYADVDMAWKANPFDAMRQVDPTGKADLIVTPDAKRLPDLGIKSHSLCSCFMYARPTEHAKAVMSRWGEMLGTKPHVNQAAFVKAFHERRKSHPDFAAAALPMTQFPPGWYHPKSPTVVHANWMIGHRAKKGFLQKEGLWSIT